MLDKLMRRSAADPDNHALLLNVVHSMARNKRSSELVNPLLDREAWNNAGAHAQNLAGIDVHRRLGMDWDFRGFETWSCENRHACDRCEGSGGVPRSGMNNQGFKCQQCDGEGVETRTISHRLATFTHAPSGIEFNLLPGFTHREDSVVYRNEPFLIARGPVTERQYSKHERGIIASVIGDEVLENPNLPKTGVRFEDVKEWLEWWLEYDESNVFSLPTAAQCQYACRAGSTTRFYWGDEFDPSHVWFAGNSGLHSQYCSKAGKPHSRLLSCCPGEYGPHASAEHDKGGRWNSFGLVDCIGNVWEWLDDGSTLGESFGSAENSIRNLNWGPMDNASEYSQVGFRPIKTIDWSD